MAIDIVRGVINNITAATELVNVINSLDKYTGTLYLGYPLSSTSESVITVDGLLVTKEKGLTAFIFESNSESVADAQDLLYYQINNTLTKYESLRTLIYPWPLSIFIE